MAIKKAAKKSSVKKSSVKKASTKKAGTTKTSTKKVATKKTASRKTATKKSASKKSAAKKASTRKYSPSASADVRREMDAMKKGKLKSGPGGKGGKVTNPKQAIAIALSEARAKGKKVPPAPKKK